MGQKDLLEKEMATHSSFLALKIPWTAEPVHRMSKSQTRLSDWACTNTQGAAQAQGTVLNVL